MRLSRRSSRVALAISVVVIFVASLGGIATAVQVGGGTIGGFEVDGNFAVNGGAGSLDWTNVSPVIVNDDTADSGFTEGSKELKPSSWDCGTGGATPNKGNILRSYVGTRVDGTGSFVFLGFVAENVSGQGDVHLNFEFSQHGTAEDPGDFTPGDCSIPRAAGDLLVSFDYAGGDTNPVVNLFKWQPAVHPDGNHDGDWIDQNLSASAAKAAVNPDTVSDPVNPTDGSIDAGRFGEAAIDLSLALPQLPGGHCTSFGYMNVRSRSSGESETSAIQDKLPTTGVDLSTCGSIKIHKTDDHVPPHALAGATFGLYDNDTASGTPLQTKVTGANGTATFGGLDPGDYWVKEISAPSGYSPDPDIVKVTVGVLENVDVTAPFVDPRDVGSVRIYKDLRDDHGVLVTPDPMSAVNGASFVLYKDGNGNSSYDSGEAVKLWPAETADATCTITNGLGYCDIPASGFAVPTGTYRVHETAAPADTGSGSDVGPVVVVKNTRVDVHYTNTLSPLNITIHKSGSSTQAHVGDTIHYTANV